MDMEKVIKGIDICLQRFRCGEDCPYYNTEKIGCMEQLREDAIALLKEQEAVKPYHVNTNHEQHWKCGNCNAVISLQDKYCSSCGKHILWDDSKGEEWDW